MSVDSVDNIIDRRIFTKEELLRWQNDEKFQLKQVRKNGFDIQYIHNPSEKVQLLAVKQNGYSIKYIEKSSELIQLEAIKQDGRNIKYIYNPSFEVCEEALYQNPECIQYIDIEKYPELYEKYLFLVK